MKRIPTIVFALAAASPAIACPDWKAVAALDAIISAHVYDGITSEAQKKAIGEGFLKDVGKDHDAAIADTCKEDAR